MGRNKSNSVLKNTKQNSNDQTAMMMPSSINSSIDFKN